MIKNQRKSVGGHRAGAGRPPGTPNKATAEARVAISAFVNGNAHRLQDWLDQIAAGVPKQRAKDADPKDPVEYLVKPNPQVAFELFQSVIEYHVPKLQRTEVTGPDGGAVIIQSTRADDNL